MVTEAQIALRRVASINPATGEILHEFDCATDEAVRAAVVRARAAQPGWQDLGVLERLGCISRFQQLLLDRKSDVARLITREAGKPYAESLSTELIVVLDGARFLAESAYALLREDPVRHGSLATKTKAGKIRREPYGVIGIISPWNYPFSIPATEAMAALAAGNAVVLKPSELTPSIALELASLLYEAGVPRDVFQVLVGDGLTGAALLDSPIDKLIFTGSVSTGTRIAEAAARKLLPVVLELGGKDPMIVLNDADIDVASSGAVWGAFVNAGQACLSVERCYVHRSVYEPFLQACVGKAQRLRIGDGMDPETDIGPMIHERQLRVVETQVEDARAQGARILNGGTRLASLGPSFYAPTVLADVNHEMRVMREETFGPVLPIMPFDDEEEAVRLANDTEYGLAASVWTRDRQRGEALARRIIAGTVMVNDAVSCFGISEAPHGGVKASGIGRTHGKLGLEEMVRVKYVSSERLPSIKKAWWYPYSGKFRRQIEGLPDLLYSSSPFRRFRNALQSSLSFFAGKGKF